jgi:hypothetical protein
MVAVAFVPKPFDHKYVPPPLAVLVTLVVVQFRLSEPVMLMVGFTQLITCKRTSETPGPL